MGLFHLHNRWKYRLFQFFPLAESTAKAFSGYPFGTSRKKASAIFYNTALKNISRLLCGTVQKNLKKQRRNAVPKKGLPVLWGIHIFNEHNAITSKNTNWPLSGRLCYSLWLFHLHSALKIQPFSSIFPLAGSTAKGIFLFITLEFQEKKHQPFSITQPSGNIRKTNVPHSLPLPCFLHFL